MSVDGILDYATQRSRYKARQLVGRHGFTASDVKDIQQNLLTDVIERLSKFNGDRACARTFVSRIIDNRIASLIRYQNAACRDCRSQECSLDDWVRDETGAWVRRDTTIDAERSRAHTGCFPRPDQDRSDMAADVAVVIADLPSHLRDLCLRLQTRTFSEISRDTGISRSCLYRRIAEIRRRFVALDLDPYA